MYALNGIRKCFYIVFVYTKFQSRKIFWYSFTLCIICYKYKSEDHKNKVVREGEYATILWGASKKCITIGKTSFFFGSSPSLISNLLELYARADYVEIAYGPFKCKMLRKQREKVTVTIPFCEVSLPLLEDSLWRLRNIFYLFLIYFGKRIRTLEMI